LDAVFVLESFKRSNIECPPSLVAVSLRSEEEKVHAARLRLEQFEVLSAALTESQRAAIAKFKANPRRF
jgi:hypothetical protein